MQTWMSIMTRSFDRRSHTGHTPWDADEKVVVQCVVSVEHDLHATIIWWYLHHSAEENREEMCPLDIDLMGIAIATSRDAVPSFWVVGLARS